jgi:MFS family permease
MSIARHNERVFWWSALLMGVSFLEPVLTLFYLAKGMTNAQILLTITAMQVTNLLCEVPTGAFADRFGPKRAFLVGSLFRMGAPLLLLLWPTIPAFYLAQVVKCIGWTFFSGAEEAVIYESLKAEGQESRMTAVMGRLSGAIALAATATAFIGPILAKDLTEGQFKLVVALDLVAAVLRLFVLARVIEPPSFHEERLNPWRYAVQAAQEIKRNRPLFRLAVRGTVIFIPTYLFGQFQQPLLTGAGLPVAWIGTAVGLGGLLAWFLGNKAGSLRERFGTFRLIKGMEGLILLGVLGALAGAYLGGRSALALPLVLSVLFSLRAANALRNPAISELTNAMVPSDGRSTTLSMLQLLDSVCDLVVVPLIALLANRGLTWLFAGAIVTVLVGSLFRLPTAAEAERRA